MANIISRRVRRGAEKMEEELKIHFPDAVVTTTEMQFQDLRNYRVSSEKAKRLLNWKSKWSIDDGIEEIKELIESRRLKDLKNPRYTNQLFLSQFTPDLKKLNV